MMNGDRFAGCLAQMWTALWTAAYGPPAPATRQHVRAVH